MSLHTITRGFNGAGLVRAPTENVTVNGGGQVEPTSIANGVSNQQLAGMNIDFSQLISLMIYSTVAMLFETNDSTTPINTISLKAGIPYIWSSPGSYDACLITADVTAGFVTNASGGEGTVEAAWGYFDVTVP